MYTKSDHERVSTSASLSLASVERGLSKAMRKEKFKEDEEFTESKSAHEVNVVNCRVDKG
jgi:hypothetical protein